MENWRVLPFQYYSAFENMAMDEALFRVLQERGGPPTLRFYGWEKPALSIGYFQNVTQEINLKHCQNHNVTIVRRPTGGKAVLHEWDLTYAVISRETPPLFSCDLIGNYLSICACLIRGFAELNIEVRTATDNRQRTDQNMGAICFAHPAPFELLSRGRKICGSAQVRSRGCFLQHGSLALDFDPVKNSACFLSALMSKEERCDYLEKKVTSIYNETGEHVVPEKVSIILQRAFEKEWQVRFDCCGLTPEEKILTNTLLTHKYAHSAWNMEGKA